jgi:hypothetical protein
MISVGQKRHVGGQSALYPPATLPKSVALSVLMVSRLSASFLASFGFIVPSLSWRSQIIELTIGGGYWQISPLNEGGGQSTVSSGQLALVSHSGSSVGAGHLRRVPAPATCPSSAVVSSRMVSRLSLSFLSSLRVCMSDSFLACLMTFRLQRLVGHK